VLASSERGEEGRNTSALSLSEAVGASVSLALSGLVFTAVTAWALAPFVATLAYTSLVAVVALAVAFVVGVTARGRR
jgi:hypothetical protein